MHTQIRIHSKPSEEKLEEENIKIIATKKLLENNLYVSHSDLHFQEFFAISLVNWSAAHRYITK